LKTEVVDKLKYFLRGKRNSWSL